MTHQRWRLCAVALVLGASPLHAQVSPESLDVVAEQDGEWKVRARPRVIVSVTSRFVDQIYLDSARLERPEELRCGAGTADALVFTAENRDLTEGEVLEFEISGPTAECISTAMLNAGSGPGRLRIWYWHSSREGQVFEQSVALAWVAPLVIVLAGGVCGVLLSFALISLAHRTARLKARKWDAPAAEIGFGVVTVLILVLLAHSLAPSEWSVFLETIQLDKLKAGSFGHGLLLGLTYQTAGVALIAWMRRTTDEQPTTPDGPIDQEPVPEQAPAREAGPLEAP